MAERGRNVLHVAWNLRGTSIGSVAEVTRVPFEGIPGGDGHVPRKRQRDPSIYTVSRRVRDTVGREAAG